ncbi:MAG: hypothetical protein R8G66_27300 [Cytophagales bacterium]|nr:hypothetical protein [Cytophagales bacterium]
MKINWIFLMSMMLLSCQDEKATFEEVPCVETPDIPNSNRRLIFKPCRTFIYKARYWDHEYNLLSDELIQVDVSGRGWEYQPDRQDEIVIQYQYETEDIGRLQSYSLNPDLSYWTKKTTTGIIENEDRFWIHPFRSNQYDFTEVAPFPEVTFPLSIGKIWGGSLNIGEGWGVWGHSTVNHRYEVLAHEHVEIPFGVMTAWEVSSIATAPYGTSFHNFWFHEDYGFVKMTVNNYANQTLQFQLIEVIDR